MTYPCPHCRADADLTTGCPGCGRGPDPDAASVVQLDAEIAALTPRAATARDTLMALEAQLRDLWQRRNAAAARVRRSLNRAEGAPHAAPPSPAGPASASPGSASPGSASPGSASPGSASPGFGAPGWAGRPPRAPRSKEASTKLVQNALFLLGGLLLGVAAIVFTAVAWSQFGVQGRALLLAGFTGAALAVPPLAIRRGLTATAETFAAVGLLMVLLDGYAAWYVDLFGVAGHAPFGYAGAVFAVTAAIAAGYEHVTGLTGPRLAALVAAQPVLPLLIAPLHPNATGWSFTFAAVALMNLAVIHLRTKLITPLGVAAYAFGLATLAVAGLTALTALALADHPAAAAAAGAALVLTAAIPVAAAVLARSTVFQSLFGGTLVIAVAIAGARLADLADRHTAPVLIAGIAALLALLVEAAAGTLPPTAKRVLRIAALRGLHVGAQPPTVDRDFRVEALPSTAGPGVRDGAQEPAARRGLRIGFLSPIVRLGPWTGALVVLAVPTLVAAVSALESAVSPAFRATAAVPAGDWRLMAVLALLTLGMVASLRRTRVALTGAALLALAAPASFHLAWWTAPLIDLLVAAAALALAVRATTRSTLLWPAGIAAVLSLHAVGVGLSRPGVAAATLAAIALLGATTAAAARSALLIARHSRVIAAEVLGRRRLLGGLALAIGLLALPAAVGNLAAAGALSGAAQARLALAAAALITGAAHAVTWKWADYRRSALGATLLTLVSTPAWALAADDPAAIYAGVSLVLVALLVPVARGKLGFAPTGPSGPVGARAAKSSDERRSDALAATGMTAVVLGLALAAAAGHSLLSVLVLPLGRRSRIWAGRPGGAGLDPSVTGHVATADVVAIVLLAVAAALGAWLLRGRRAAIWAALPAVSVALPMALAAARLPWPAVPGASLLAGLSGLVALALRAGRASGTGGFGAAGAGAFPASVTAGVLAVDGLSGALATRGMTLAAFGAIVIAGVLAGTGARNRTARLAARLSAVVALLAFAYTSGQALDLSLPTTAFLVLGAAAIALGAGTFVSDVEGRAVQAAAHAGAVLALLLAMGSVRSAAAVCTFWGLALGVRALRPGERAAVRHVLVVAAAAVEVFAWWLLISDLRVFTLEVYTLPAAAVALLAGLLALRSRPALSSWTAYGPALAAALLPTLASVLVGSDHPLRRLLLGVAALAVVLAGAYARLQAPVVAGGIVLALVALHELVLVWDLLPRWIPLATGGLLLVGLAMTLERRRRDLARFRSALTRMS